MCLRTETKIVGTLGENAWFEIIEKQLKVMFFGGAKWGLEGPHFRKETLYESWVVICNVHTGLSSVVKSKKKKKHFSKGHTDCPTVTMPIKSLSKYWTAKDAQYLLDQ